MLNTDTRCHYGCFCLFFYRPALLVAIPGVKVGVQCVLQLGKRLSYMYLY